MECRRRDQPGESRSTLSRPWVKLLWVVLLLSACSAQGTAEPAPTTSAVPLQPNIILLLADDMDMSLVQYMPQLKTLMTEQGTTLTNFFINVPTCCPSRASILRGQLAQNTGVFANAGSMGGFDTFYRRGMEQSTIATWLQEAGYHTILIGKYLNRYPVSAADTYVPPGWSDWYGWVTRGPVKNPYYSYTLNQNGTLVDYGPGPEAYQTDVFKALALERITAASEQQKPFFLFLAPFAPHQPADPAERHKALLPEVRLPRSPSFNEAEIGDKPLPFRGLNPLDPTEIAHMEALYRRRVLSLQALDEMLAALVETLERNGQLANSYIIFSSDNGFHMGEHRMMPSKFTPFEEDIHVPTIVRGPGIAAGVVSDAVAMNIDLAPTIAELAGVTAPDFVDGRSLLPLLGLRPMPEQPWRQTVLVEYWLRSPDRDAMLGRYGRLLTPSPASALPATPAVDPEAKEERLSERLVSSIQYRALRTPDYLYVEYYHGEIMLYARQEDPYELENIAATADPALLEQLSQMLDQLSGCAGASCRALDASRP